MWIEISDMSSMEEILRQISTPDQLLSSLNDLLSTEVPKLNSNILLLLKNVLRITNTVRMASICTLLVL